MSENEFLIWLKGFRDCVGEGKAPTPEQWGAMNEKLNEVLAERVRQLMLKDEAAKQPPMHVPTWTIPQYYDPTFQGGYVPTITTTSGTTTPTTWITKV